MATLSGRPQYTPTTSKKAYGAGAQWVLPSPVSHRVASASLSLDETVRRHRLCERAIYHIPQDGGWRRGQGGG